MKKIVIILSVLALLAITVFTACNFNIKKESKNIVDTISNSVIHADYIKDTINIFGTKIRIFGNDSTYSYYSRGNIWCIEYNVDNYPIAEKVFYEDGIIRHIEYNVQYSKDSLYREFFYPVSEKLSLAVWAKDTVIITDENPIYCHEFYTQYYENGKIETFGYQGVFNGQGISVGVHNSYDSLGYLCSTDNFIYPKNKQPYIIITEYYNNGKPKSEKMYVNHAIHDSDKEEPIGTWKYYNENGEIIRTEQHNPCDNF